MNQKIQIPETWMGEPIEGAMERVLNENRKEKSSLKDVKKPASIANGVVLGDLSKYILLEGGNAYPDLVVSMGRLSYSSEIEQATRKLNLKIKNNNQNYIGNIYWNEAHKMLESVGHQMLTLRQFADFLKLLRDGKAYDGKGDKITKSVLNDIYQDITAVKDPWRGEWIDAQFEVRRDEYLIRGYKDKTLKNITKNTLLEDKTPGISLDDWLDNHTDIGLPNSNTKEGKLYYWYPRDSAVAWFYAYSVRAGLSCYGDPDDRIDWLGVRAVRAKN